ncbi:YfhO family protein [Spirillospora sp. NPDC049024]
MRPAPPERFRWITPGAKTLAAAMTIGVFCLSGALRGTTPFGGGSRNLNDLGNQFGPMHAHLAAILRGTADGDLFFNWNSGMGVPFLPDFHLYLASPLAPLTALFPPERIDLAMFVITVAKMALASVTMTVYLNAVTPRGPRWQLGLFGSAYGLCAWAVDDAAYVPQWLDGLVFLPLLCLVGEWTLQRRRWTLGVLIVAAAWYANFYTAYMATLGAAAIVLARFLTVEMSSRDRLAAGARYAASAACGLALAMPLFVPTFIAAGHAPPTTGHSFDVSPVVFLARLLPASEGVGQSPSICVGTLVLLAVSVFPFDRAIPRRSRVVWSSLPLLLALSFQRPGQYVWNGFDAPDGSPYREAFVLCAALVIVGWIGVTRGRPGRRSVLCASAFHLVMLLLALVSPLASRHAPALLIAGALAAAAAVGAARWSARRPDDRRARTALVTAAVGLTAFMLLEQTVTAVFIDQRRAQRFEFTAPWNSSHEERVQAIRSVDGFPRYRTEPGGPGLTANDPMLLGGQGAGYYSSVLPLDTSRTLIDLGYPYDRWGRQILPADNPVLDAIFAVGAQATDSKGRPAPSRRAAAPLVTLRSATRPLPAGADPFRVQEAVLGSEVYRYPKVRWAPVGGAPEMTSPGGRPHIPSDARGRARYEATVSCSPGSSVAGWTPKPPGGRFRDRSGPGMVSFGTVPVGGTLKITIRAGAEAAPAPVVGCADPALLRAAVERLRSGGARRVRVSGHRIEAEIPRGRPGVAVVSVPLVDGWKCSIGDGPARRPRSHDGLIAVPVDGSSGRLSCGYTPPGLFAGTALGLAGLSVTLGAAYIGRRRRLRGKAAESEILDSGSFDADPSDVRDVSETPTPDRPRS